MKKNFRRLSPPITHAAAVRAWTRVIRTDAWLRGPAVARFERKLAALAGVAPEQVVATDTCTNALAAAGDALHSHEPGALLKVCPLTYAGTYSWFGPYCLQDPSWVDCDEHGWPVAPVDIRVALWGRETPGSSVILDAAHRFRPEEIELAFAAGIRAVCWSFGPMKELPGVRGGAAVLAERDHAVAVRQFLNNGIDREGVVCGAPGRKGLMANAEAAFLERQLDKLDVWRAHRQRILRSYEKFFPERSPVARLITRPGEASGHLCVLKFFNHGQREILRAALARHNVETSIHYPVPDDAPEGCRALSRRVLSLPCHPNICFADVRRVANIIIRSS